MTDARYIVGEGRQEVVKVYGRRSDVHRTLDGEDTERVFRHVKIAEMPKAVAFETMVGLAEMMGYEVRPE